MIDPKVEAEITACLIPHAINSVVIVKLTLLKNVSLFEIKMKQTVFKKKIVWFLNCIILITLILIN